MKSLLANEFEAARTALLDAATAVDALNPEDAIIHLQSLRAACDIIEDLLVVFAAESKDSQLSTAG